MLVPAHVVECTTALPRCHHIFVECIPAPVASIGRTYPVGIDPNDPTHMYHDSGIHQDFIATQEDRAEFEHWLSCHQ